MDALSPEDYVTLSVRTALIARGVLADAALSPREAHARRELQAALKDRPTDAEVPVPERTALIALRELEAADLDPREVVAARACRDRLGIRPGRADGGLADSCGRPREGERNCP